MFITIMITIAQAVEEVFGHDDVALAAARNGWLNFSSYARSIRTQVEAAGLKDVQEGSIVTALSRCAGRLLERHEVDLAGVIQSLAIHANLEGLTYERSERVSQKIREIYPQLPVASKAFLTVTQGINEITIVAGSAAAETFRAYLHGSHKVYDKPNLVGITVKFTLRDLETPNVIFALTRRLAFRNINIIEVVSTATELTYVVEKKDLAVALEQLQKNI